MNYPESNDKYIIIFLNYPESNDKYIIIFLNYPEVCYITVILTLLKIIITYTLNLYITKISNTSYKYYIISIIFIFFVVDLYSL